MLQLKPYQQEDVVFLSQKDSAGCFNQQRTGKTPTILITLQTKGTVKNLVVCPASLLYQWKEEYERWLHLPCIVITGTPKQKEKAIWEWTYGAVISYDSLKSTKTSDGMIDLILKRNPDAVVFDEAHRLKNPKTANFKSAKKLTKVPIRYVLTGTPAPNKAEEVFSLLHIINPVKFSSYYKFVDNYFKQEWSFAGRQHKEIAGFLPGMEKALQTILSECATSRKRKDVMAWLPQKDYIRLKLPCTSQQTKYLAELSEFFETEHVMTQGTLDRLIRYRQICLDPALLELKGKSPKTDWIVQYIKDYPEKPVIIFSKFTSYLSLLIHELYKNNMQPTIISGHTPAQDRQRIVTDFQKGKCNILLLNIDAGKEGLTLDRAETIIFTDKYPPVGDIEQAEDRFVATREELKDKPHIIIELCMKDTYDEQLYDLLEKRKSETDVINNFKQYLGGTK